MEAKRKSRKPELYFIKDAEEITSRNRQTLRRWWEQDNFPKPMMLNKRLAWHASTIEEWISHNLPHGETSNG